MLIYLFNRKRQKRAEDIATLTSYNKIKGSIVKRATTVYKKKYNTKTHTFSNNIEIGMLNHIIMLFKYW